MKTPAKPVIRSPLDRLPLHQKQALMAWLTTGGPGGVGITYEEARKRVATEFGMRMSQMAIHGFYYRHRRQPVSEPIETTVDAEKITIVIHLRK